MKDIIRHARQVLCSTPDSVCLERAQLVTEAYRRYEHEPLVLRRAKTFAHVLEHMTLDLQTNPIFAGNTSSRPRAWMLLPEYGFDMPAQVGVEDESLKRFLDTAAVPDQLRSFWQSRSFGGAAGVGHLAVNLSRVLSEGLQRLIAEADSHLDDADSQRRDYRQAVVIACRAVIAWAHRYAQAAAGAARHESGQSRKRALLRVARACRHVPAKPARNLFEALQSIVLVHLAIHIEGHGYSVSPALLDRVLLDYYGSDQEVTELLAAFMLKLSANSVWGSHSKTQAITLGGLDHRGDDKCNPLTLHFLDACQLVRMPDPHVFIRWHDDVDRRVKTRAVELLGSGLSMPMLIGDQQTAQGFLAAGVAPEDAWNYCVIGCNELGIPGKLASSASGPWMNHLAVVNAALLDNGVPYPCANMDALLSRIESAVSSHLRTVMQGHSRHRLSAAQQVPTPFTSALMDGCIAAGRDMHAQMAYNLPGLMELGFVNAVNALAAIHSVTFDRKAASLAELAQAVRENFPDQGVRKQLLAAPKWGNDDDRADQWALKLLQTRDRAKAGVSGELHLPEHLSCHVVRSLNYVHGRQLGASPDGRRAGEPLADSVGPQVGTSHQGPTAILNSAIKLAPAVYFQGGYNLNLTVSAHTASKPVLQDSLIAMTDAFFAGGGQELQINCLDIAALRDAQRHPERYPDLLVRIAGFNALFVRLSTSQQEDLIKRAEGSR